MKSAISSSLSMLVSAAFAQPDPLAVGNTAEQVRVMLRDRDYQVIERVARESLGDGTVVLKTNWYTVLGTGISYWRDNQWKDSNPRFSLAPGRAVADEGLFQLALASDVAAEGAVEWVTPDSKRFVTSPRWLAYYNTVSANWWRPTSCCTQMHSIRLMPP